jgi:hypothetical protein
MNKYTSIALLAVTLWSLGSSTLSQAAPGEITGTVRISPALQSKIGSTAVLYIIARPEGQIAGPPAAVKRFTQPIKSPVQFSITGQDSMMGSGTLDGKFTLTARVSQSGSATPAATGDLQPKAPAVSATAGGKPVTITIDQVRP